MNAIFTIDTHKTINVAASYSLCLSVCPCQCVVLLHNTVRWRGRRRKKGVCEQKVVHLVDKLLDQLKVLRPDALGAVDKQHQVDVAGPAGWERRTQRRSQSVKVPTHLMITLSDVSLVDAEGLTWGCTINRKKTLRSAFRRTAISFLNAGDSDWEYSHLGFFCRLPLVDCKGHKG